MYTGHFFNNKKEGQGRLEDALGGVYEGQWLNNRREGQGTQTDRNGATYSGQWRDNKRAGQGSMLAGLASTHFILPISLVLSLQELRQEHCRVAVILTKHRAAQYRAPQSRVLTSQQLRQWRQQHAGAAAPAAFVIVAPHSRP